MRQIVSLILNFKALTNLANKEIIMKSNVNKI